jgi:hypothetical protein
MAGAFIDVEFDDRAVQQLLRRLVKQTQDLEPA